MPLAAPSTEILLALDPVPEAVRTARHALQDAGVGEDVDHTVSLLTSEIVGNAVRHASLRREDQIVFFARISGDHVRVEVADRGPGFDPEIRHHTAGFGLRLLDKLAARWGVERTGQGCRVWFEVDRRRRRLDRADD